MFIILLSYQSITLELKNLGVELVIGVRATASIVVPRRVRPTALPILRDEEAVRARRAHAVGEQLVELLDAIFVLRRQQGDDKEQWSFGINATAGC